MGVDGEVKARLRLRAASSFLLHLFFSEFCSDLRNPVKCIARQDTAIALGSSSVYTHPCHVLFLLGLSDCQSRTDVIQAIYSK